jgi:hypothetical protein
MLESRTTLGTLGESLFFRAIIPSFPNSTAMRHTLRLVSICRTTLASGSGGNRGLAPCG